MATVLRDPPKVEVDLLANSTLVHQHRDLLTIVCEVFVVGAVQKCAKRAGLKIVFVSVYFVQKSVLIHPRKVLPKFLQK